MPVYSIYLDSLNFGLLGIMQTDVNSKILSVEQLSEICLKLHTERKRVAHCHGCFDLMHPGHIKYFQAAKAIADVLVVTVTPDRFIDKGPNRPAFPEKLRAESIAALACVDYVAINLWATAVETLRLLRPDFYVKGQEFETLADATGKLQQEYLVVEEIGAQMHFTQEIVFSSTTLLEQHFGISEQRSKKPQTESILTQSTHSTPSIDPVIDKEAFLKHFRQKHSVESLINALENLKNLRVMLIGDTIIDQYYYCDTMGKASKSSVVAHRYLNHQTHAGGVCAVANHVAEVVDQIQLVSVLGQQNSQESFIRQHLKSHIDSQFFFRSNGPTVVKKRYLNQDNSQKIFEVNELTNEFIEKECEKAVIEYLIKEIDQYDLVLVSDFGHGFISNAIIRTLEQRAKYLAVNAQTNSANAGFNLITRYQKSHYICIDEMELRLAAQERFSDIQQVAQDIAERIQAETLMVTLGAKGSMGFTRNLKNQSVINTPSFSSNLVDAIGAGDAFFAYTAPAMAKGLPLDFVSFIGNAVGSLAIQVIGNQRAIQKKELIQFIQQLFNQNSSDNVLSTTISASVASSSSVEEEPKKSEISPLKTTFTKPSSITESVNAYYCDFSQYTSAITVTNQNKELIKFECGVELASRQILALSNTGKKMMFIGNGASAAISSHMSADFSKSGGIKAMNFNDAPLVTAVSNDIAYHEVFALPLKLFAEVGDILIAISSSGKSENILRGVQVARESGCQVITFSGFQTDNPLRALGDINFYVPACNYGQIEVLHHSICHCILDIVIKHG